MRLFRFTVFIVFFFYVRAFRSRRYWGPCAASCTIPNTAPFRERK